MDAFQTLTDASGNLYMAGGMAWQISTGTLLDITERGYPVNVLSTMGEVNPESPGSQLSGLVPAAGPEKIHQAEGSGRCLILNIADSAVCTEWKRLPRVFRPGPVADTWVSGYWTITKTGASTAELSDQSDVIAEMTTGTAPFGTYDATTIGEDDYNGSSAWSVDAEEEPGAPGNYAKAKIDVSEGSFPTGEIFESADGVTWGFPMDTLVTVVVAGDGSAELFYDTDVIAERAAGGDPTSPDGIYEATATGETDYNSGNPWAARILAMPIAPLTGWIYAKVILSTGMLAELQAPYFASALPGDTADLKHVPIAYSNGAGKVTQHHKGLIIIP